MSIRGKRGWACAVDSSRGIGMVGESGGVRGSRPGFGLEGGPGEPEVLPWTMGVRVSSVRGPSTARPRTFHTEPVSSSMKALESKRKVSVWSPETPVVDAGGANISGGSYVTTIQRRGRARREEDHYRRPTYIVVDDGGLFQPEEGVGHRLTTKLHSRYTLHGAEASVLGADEQEWRGVDVVVAGVGIAAVLAGEAVSRVRTWSSG